MGCVGSKPEDAGDDGPNGATTNLVLPKAAAAGVHHMRVIFAKPMDMLLGGPSGGGYSPPVHAKSSQDEKFLTEALPKNFVFEHLTTAELNLLVNAMESCSYPSGEDIIKQGDDGDYFYVIKSGSVEFIVDGKVVGRAEKGATFGELALLYTSPRAATVRAATATSLFRADQTVFRFILQQQSVHDVTEKLELLKKVTFLKDLDNHSMNKLAQVMVHKQAKAGEVLMEKGDIKANHFYILLLGSVECTNIGVGEAKFENFTMSNPGDYFGERALVTGEPRAATVTCKTDVVYYTIDKETFETVLGDFKTVILKAQEKRQLHAIKILADSKLTDQGLTSLVQLIKDRTFPAGTYICQKGKESEAALYLVRSGCVKVGTNTIPAGGYFGDDQLRGDVDMGVGFHIGSPSTVAPTYSAIVEGTDEAVCGVLTLVACRKVFDTRLIGTPNAGAPGKYDSIVEGKVKLEDLKRHRILGAGTFGQVWLVSRKAADGTRVAYALKVQSKYELVKDGQAKAVVYEKNIMAQLHHPFLIGLVNTYHDENFVYILLELVQGGELYSYMHTTNRNYLSESDARFYAACIAEGLGFMHRRGYVYRDLKPENVLVDKTGYCVIIDFGFAKFVPDKTFTLCGTPLYIPPEVILNRGHNGSADHWSLGVLIYEMLTGETPFYKHGMEQMDLFRAIVKGRFEIPSSVSADAAKIIRAFLTKDPSQRLGALAGGEDGIPLHPWFQPMNFDNLRTKTIKPPVVPKIANPLDSSNFEDWSHLDDKSKMKFPKLTREEAKVFENF